MNSSEGLNAFNTEELAPLLPDTSILTLFQAKEEELDALGSSRSRFTDIAKTLLKYQDTATEKRKNQEKSLKELHSLQKNIKNFQRTSAQEKQKLEKDISLLESEKDLLTKKQTEITALLKRFYQQVYIQNIHSKQDITLLSLLFPKSF
jgi:chromosome segregation ATPase